ncbi:MAG: hypothetical protein U5J98_01835 [Halobacteriales archaeon]|nr:hypothetical protein [Halobacteriales archaeon]
MDTATNFKGAPLALNFTNGTDTTYELDEDGDPFSGPFSSGTNSTLAVFDSSSATVGSTYNVTIDTTDDGFGDMTGATLSFRTLTVSASSDDVTTSENVTVDLDISSGNRNIEVTLTDSDDNEDASAVVKVGGNGEATVDLGPQSADDYTVEAQDVNSGVSDSVDITVSEAADTDATFDQTVYEEQRGDVIPINVSFTQTTSATVQIGSNSSGFNTTLTLTDGGDEDGYVTVLFNTSATAITSQDAYQVADSDDTVTNNTVRPTSGTLTTPLAVGSYDMSVKTGSTERDVAQINVLERSTESLTTGISPGGVELTTRAGVLKNTADSGTVSTADNVTVTIDVSGLEGDSSGIPLDGTNGISLNVTEQNAGQNADPIALNGSGTGVTLIHDTANDTIYAVIDVSAAGFEVDDEVEVEFRMEGSNTPDGVLSTSTFLLGSGEIETVSSTFTVAEDSVSIDSDPVVVGTSDSEAISRNVKPCAWHQPVGHYPVRWQLPQVEYPSYRSG